MQVLFDHVKNESPTVKTFYFKPNEHLDYEAGQFVDLTIPDVGRRYFTLSSCPEEHLLSITTVFADKLSDYKQALFNLKPGDVLDISEPMGDFVLPLDTTRHLTFIIGGIGATPVRSICKHLLMTNQKRNIKLLYSSGQASEHIFRDVFDNYQSKYTESAKTGRIKASDIIRLANPKQNDLIYISGPEQMVERLRDDLIEHKINAEQIVGDYFNGY